MKLTDADNAADGIFFPALEQNMMGAVLINENDEVMFFNPAAEKLWGYKREEVIGNNIDMLISGDSFLNFPSCTKTALRCTNVDQKLKNITLSQHSGAYPGMA